MAGGPPDKAASRRQASAATRLIAGMPSEFRDPSVSRPETFRHFVTYKESYGRTLGCRSCYTHGASRVFTRFSRVVSQGGVFSGLRPARGEPGRLAGRTAHDRCLRRAICKGGDRGPARSGIGAVEFLLGHCREAETLLCRQAARTFE